MFNNKLNIIFSPYIIFVSFLIVVLLGIFLRSNILGLFYLIPYKNILHAHSHFAFAGWISQSLLFFLNKILWKNEDLPLKVKWAYFLHLFTSFGMLITFLYQSYGAISICFSTLSLFVGYYYAYLLFKKMKNFNSLSIKLFKMALFFMIFSSIGTYFLAFLMASKNNILLFKNISIYFYLHFQYNGWFLFAILGIVFEKFYNKKFQHKYLIKYLFITTFIAFFFSLANEVKNIYLSYLLVLFSIFYFIIIFKIIRILYLKIKENIIYDKLLLTGLKFVILMILIKAFLQIISVIPSAKQIVFNNYDIIISYIHFVLLTTFSFFIWLSIYIFDVFYFNLKIKWIFISFFSLLIINQLLLFSKALVSTITLNYYSSLTLLYVSIFIAIICILFLIFVKIKPDKIITK